MIIHGRKMIAIVFVGGRGTKATISVVNTVAARARALPRLAKPNELSDRLGGLRLI